MASCALSYEKQYKFHFLWYVDYEKKMSSSASSAFISFITACISSCGKIIFSQACVIPSVHRAGGGLHAEGGLHLGGLHPGGACIQGKGFASGGVCIQGGLHMGRPPPEYHRIRSTSGRYASYWNAFLFSFLFELFKCANSFNNLFPCIFVSQHV